MFFMMGITDGRKVFDYTQTVICNICGKLLLTVGFVRNQSEIFVR